ncbi:MAG: Flp pilus assembly complex ATPase component TadA [Clostridia bacterium]|nr:Flp pilus assembly complex ATPase component TadA [Clostridia bacterium]
MALFDNQAKNRPPLGVELIRRGLIKDSDINEAVNYQKAHPGVKLGEAFHMLKLVPDKELLDVIAEQIEAKPIILDPISMTFKFTDYLSMDIVKQHKVMPFEIEGNKLKIAFADPNDRNTKNMIRLILLSKGIAMEEYVTFASYIDEIVKSLESNVDTPEAYDTFGQDNSQLVDNIIRSAMSKRASDIHFEPMDNRMRVRFRIDGELIEITSIEKPRQNQIIGRLKAISNMHQEKQTSQDGRIIMYPDYNIRVSSQRNIYGEKMVLRLMKKDANIQGLEELGYSNTAEIMEKCFNKRNCITLITAPTGEGKTTTLYSAMNELNRPEINITTIEDPVEIRLPGLNQIEINANVSFADSLRTILRQDPDIILVGEIRDEETAEIAVQAGQTGHFVLATLHTVDSLEAITRLRKLGVSNYDIGSVLATSIGQRLVRRVCPYCAQKREFTKEEKETIENIGKRFEYQFNLENKSTYKVVGCEKCNNTGYYNRIAAYEILEVSDRIRELIVDNKPLSEIRKVAYEEGYRPLIVDAFNKVLEGYTTLEEVRKKLTF